MSDQPQPPGGGERQPTEEEIRGLLNASGASLVGGPTSADAYLLSVPATQRTSALHKLQSDDQVQMAEPIDGVRP